jgi:hypothetical protein
VCCGCVRMQCLDDAVAIIQKANEATRVFGISAEGPVQACMRGGSDCRRMGLNTAGGASRMCFGFRIGFGFVSWLHAVNGGQLSCVCITELGSGSHRAR